ncbi:uncharacterized protein MICPUCDRAFT_66825 [Micromonas pusilla CCMP1545]|uniref:Predicted protein n=1 Tax=Micromonas pusilla (strain CCMP1545) TaxID=564608 RepID=C1N4P9_MICPC|nr:uncharacterized protein MICPUCDRAFT_66825 [Micromonas pusilla CCMP1545]EEH52767.1 predicted protein [Micromonas pusilla CCMP1545]|eukprot:XP_003062828.1 predicted protein [Micromonas pusilla CCMP1545]
MSTARSVSATDGCVHPRHVGKEAKSSRSLSAAVTSFPTPGVCVDACVADDAASPPTPGRFFRASTAAAAISATPLGSPFGDARSSGTGTCIATEGDSRRATLSTGNDVTSATMASCTSRRTRSTPVLLPLCHWSIASRKSTLLPGATGGGAGAWYIVTPILCARPSSGRNHPPPPPSDPLSAARGARATRRRPTTRRGAGTPPSPPARRTPRGGGVDVVATPARAVAARDSTRRAVARAPVARVALEADISRRANAALARVRPPSSARGYARALTLDAC